VVPSHGLMERGAVSAAVQRKASGDLGA